MCGSCRPIKIKAAPCLIPEGLIVCEFVVYSFLPSLQFWPFGWGGLMALNLLFPHPEFLTSQDLHLCPTCSEESHNFVTWAEKAGRVTLRGVLGLGGDPEGNPDFQG